MLIDWNGVIEDPTSDQILRDLARNKVAENQRMSTKDNNTTYTTKMNPVWKNTIERNERMESNNFISETALVKIATKILLPNENSDGSTTICGKNLPDGTRDVLVAYPKLVGICRKLITNTNNEIINAENKDAVADAHLVLAALRQMEFNRLKFQREEQDFKKALCLRPNDWRIHSAMGIMYCRGEQMSLSLDCISRAAELVQDKKAKFDLLIKKGKLLSNLMQFNEAVICLEQALEDCGDIQSKMTQKDKAHAVAALHALCFSLSMSEHSKKSEQKILRYWKEAEKKRLKLPQSVMGLISWDFRDLAQMYIVKINPNAVLSLRECHHCHGVSEKVLMCAACKTAVYCCKLCQKAAWKAGHKHECTRLNTTRKEERQERRTEVKKVLIDRTLSPKTLWKKGVKLTKNGNPDEAMWNFLIALFMDFSMDKPEHLKDARKAVNRSSIKCKHIAMILGMVTFLDSNKHPVAFGSEVMKKLYADKAFFNTVSTKRSVVPTELEEDIDRKSFAFGVAHIFLARWLSRCHRSWNDKDRCTDTDLSVRRKAFQDAANLISEARNYIDPLQWLTLQYDLGYINLDIGAYDQGRTWLETFVCNLNNQDDCYTNSTHWPGYKKAAEKKLKVVPKVEKARKILGSMDVLI
eukprot:CAMPEP_0194138068 /NCGR_PEP_ID=MMETSP0152-20130528/7916_1 /TAXON_ID=1049557 /ORGANISM="Thalassiothrix antarctica, Strain L6-D1" /LENGTH=638 /DNA_ID=CAMNT_0038835377 /DNA_START=73 /DNA_END=1989 /DNA_ORIENTATION=-